MKQFEQLRKQYPIFCYQDYTIKHNDNNLHLEFEYTIGNIELVHKLSWSDISDIDTKKLENIIFHIGLVECINYWKLTCSPILRIECGNISEEQKEFFYKLFLNGLGEFIYINDIKITKDEFLQIECNPKYKISPKVDIQTTKANLIPIGGGKDSCVSYELLQDEFDSSYLFAMNPIKPTLNLMANSNLKSIKMKRVLDPQILELNKQNFLNGHVPFSAILSFISLLSASIYQLRYIPLSNESSANEENIVFNNLKINHQYSKSFEYENDFRAYCQKFLTSDIEYFSFLRPLHELHITKLFAKYKHFHSVFLSCNVGSKKGIWCAKCPKCLFTFVMLHSYLSENQMIDIFGVNMLNDIDMSDTLRDLKGDGKIKPFECVGTYDEVNIALENIKNKYKNTTLPILLQNLNIKECKPKDIDWINHNLPAKHLEILKNAF